MKYLAAVVLAAVSMSMTVIFAYLAVYALAVGKTRTSWNWNHYGEQWTEAIVLVVLSVGMVWAVWELAKKIPNQ
ncbi:MAG: hypothetical protein V3S68_03400 [Dehalococcoidia bacterium]